MNGPVARLLVARAAVLDAARAVRLSASEPGADVDRCLQLAARLDRVAEGYPPTRLGHRRAISDYRLPTL